MTATDMATDEYTTATATETAMEGRNMTTTQWEDHFHALWEALASTGDEAEVMAEAVEAGRPEGFELAQFIALGAKGVNLTGELETKYGLRRALVGLDGAYNHDLDGTIERISIFMPADTDDYSNVTASVSGSFRVGIQDGCGAMAPYLLLDVSDALAVLDGHLSDDQRDLLIKAGATEAKHKKNYAEGRGAFMRTQTPLDFVVLDLGDGRSHVLHVPDVRECEHFHIREVDVDPDGGDTFVRGEIWVSVQSTDVCWKKGPMNLTPHAGLTEGHFTLEPEDALKRLSTYLTEEQRELLTGAIEHDDNATERAAS
jgi:hypothetical protein